MIYRARVNQVKVFDLVKWNTLDFNANLTLYLQSSNLAEIKNAFKQVTLLEIYQDENPISSYTNLDTFSEISYVGTEYVEATGEFAECMKVRLTKTNIVEQVQRLDDQVNPKIDLDTLPIAELRTYKLKEISEKCQADVFAGTSVTLEDGSTEHFSYKLTDQENLASLLVLLLIAPEIEALPWHSDSNLCRMFSRHDLIKICVSLLLRKTQIITYGNSLNIYVQTMDTREELKAADYGMELPQEYLDNINTVLAITLEQVEKFIKKILPDYDPVPTPEPSEDDDEPTVEPTGDEDEPTEDNEVNNENE